MEAKQRFYSKSVIVWRVSHDDSLLAIGLMDNVYGKAQPITFLTIFNLNGNISSNHIVKYREQYGGQVADARWNKQFFEMNEESNFLKIDGISGATISVNSIKKGVMKLSLLIKTILSDLQ
ncbi:MAG: FMN-binding protein [Chlorobi bacterium]|nr:FMN-binding protein [Chlorobiota bacterium]